MKALVIQGGGSKANFAIGALKVLLYELETKYDLYCGVSSGALVAAHVAQYALGFEQEAYLDLAELFSPLENKDVWKRWFPLGGVHGIHKASVLNPAPLKELIKRNFSVQKVLQAQRKLTVGVTDINSGTYKTITEQDLYLEQYLYASSAFPVAFPPIKIAGRYYADGCLHSTVPINDAIARGATDIDVILVSPDTSSTHTMSSPSSLEVGARAIDIVSTKLGHLDLRHALLVNKLVQAGGGGGAKYINFRIIPAPGDLVKNSLHFSPKSAKVMQDKGYEAAKKVIYGT